MSRLNDFVKYTSRGYETNWDWYLGAGAWYHGITDSMLLEQVKDSISKMPKGLGWGKIISFPITRYKLERVNQYKTALQLGEDLLLGIRKKYGHEPLFQLWMDYALYFLPNLPSAPTINDYLLSLPRDGVVESFKDMRNSDETCFTYANASLTWKDVAVPEHLLIEMADKGQFGAGRTPIPARSEWIVDKTKKTYH